MIHHNHANETHQSSIEKLNQLSSSYFFSLVTQFQEKNPDNFFKLTQNESFVKLIQKKLSEISTRQLIKICIDNEKFQTFLIQIIFLQRENEIYRSHTERKYQEANWSDKLMSLVGSIDGKDILTGVLNHLNDPVRTKTDDYYKPAEAAEIRTEHARYLEGRTSIDVVMSEVSDGIYNLIQLQILDPKSNTRALYEKYIQQIVDVYGVSRANMFALTTAKYHFRMYASKNGKNQYNSEDKLIMEVLLNKFSHLLKDEKLAKKTLNKSYKKYDDIFAKLKNILVKKFLLVYEDLDRSTQQILNKIVAEYMANLIKISKNEIMAIAVIDLL